MSHCQLWNISSPKTTVSTLVAVYWCIAGHKIILVIKLCSFLILVTFIYVTDFTCLLKFFYRSKKVLLQLIPYMDCLTKNQPKINGSWYMSTYVWNSSLIAAFSFHCLCPSSTTVCISQLLCEMSIHAEHANSPITGLVYILGNKVWKVNKVLTHFYQDAFSNF